MQKNTHTYTFAHVHTDGWVVFSFDHCTQPLTVGQYVLKKAQGHLLENSLDLGVKDVNICKQH